MTEENGPEPPLKDQVLAQMGGWQGLVYSTLPVAAFVPANAIGGLGWGAGVALGVAAVILVVRLVTRSSVQPAVSGFFGVGICVVIAFAIGSAKGYYLYGIVTQAVLAVAFLVSVIVRRPLVGVLWNMLEIGGKRHTDRDWRAVPRERRAYDALTILWTLVFAVRFVVQGLLYQSDRTGWLGIARIVMGWPMFGVCLLVTYAVARQLTGAGSGASGPGDSGAGSGASGSGDSGAGSGASGPDTTGGPR
ncbi:DUF3159 domain-containing protein [Tsukamurella sp. 8F]|uniref:DUF3159 domain-containing protein n=1 Tax=unclassified Tsukamurella TaxID=2633480 RepID=UPI0023B937E8|nr:MULTISPECIES: DUF3159 domain-containing protein [unclassified Tsukamurella]MDF0531306.1 DUF3159 domain-containing protein [Tsukamurella sp. 8J]MDF0585255.1 DUF3159 domain-containing protein [Tsukamurella sp. 8F]